MPISERCDRAPAIVRRRHLTSWTGLVNGPRRDHDPAMELRRRRVPIAAALVLVGAVAAPVLGLERSSHQSEPASQPQASAAPAAPSDKPGKGPKTEKHEDAETAVTLTGVIAATTDTEGESGFTLTVGGKVYRLEVGPPWWWGDKNPLKPFVGKTVTIAGEQTTGSDELEVMTANGQTIRAPGKPPWAGGPKVVGEKRPGFAAWKAAHADGKPGRGPAAAPGQQKKGAAASPS